MASSTTATDRYSSSRRCPNGDVPPNRRSASSEGRSVHANRGALVRRRAGWQPASVRALGERDSRPSIRRRHLQPPGHQSRGATGSTAEAAAGGARCSRSGSWSVRAAGGRTRTPRTKFVSATSSLIASSHIADRARRMFWAPVWARGACGRLGRRRFRVSARSNGQTKRERPRLPLRPGASRRGRLRAPARARRPLRASDARLRRRSQPGEAKAPPVGRRPSWRARLS
jgi:hypothetical protein